MIGRNRNGKAANGQKRIESHKNTLTSKATFQVECYAVGYGKLFYSSPPVSRARTLVWAHLSIGIGIVAPPSCHPAEQIQGKSQIVAERAG